MELRGGCTITANHRDTDNIVIGATISLWKRLLELVTQAAAIFAEIRNRICMCHSRCLGGCFSR